MKSIEIMILVVLAFLVCVVYTPLWWMYTLWKKVIQTVQNIPDIVGIGICLFLIFLELMHEMISSFIWQSIVLRFRHASYRYAKKHKLLQENVDYINFNS